MNYINTFIAVSPDTKAKVGSVPLARGGKRSIAQIEYELIASHPYKFTQQEVQFSVHVERTGVTPPQLKRSDLWSDFFSKPTACMRTSPLARTYGWGLHFDSEGKVALVPMESPKYQKLSRSPSIEQTRAMRTKRE
ncbi:MAG TPA: DUF6157 family protein [Gammaproteobacteria bacterium]|nr:DUF6157 family protein [Gammaproteobacteria bacterium]